MHIPSPPHQDKQYCSPSAALLAALFQALDRCPSEIRGPLLGILETRLDSIYDDLDKKISLLLDSCAMSVEDRIYGLWMLYLSFIVFPRPRPGLQIWIGTDLFGDDQLECLRLRGPADDLPDPRQLGMDLSLLAQTFDNNAVAAIRRVNPDQLSVTIQKQSS